MSLNIYLVHAVLDPNSGTRIGFLPMVRGLREDATLENVTTLLANLSQSGTIDSFDEHHWHTTQFWATDGTLLDSTFPIVSLPSPRAVLVIKWAGGPENALRLAVEESGPIARSILNYASENDAKYAEYFAAETPATDVEAAQAAPPPTLSSEKEVTVRIAFSSSGLSVKVFTNAGEVQSCSLENPSPPQIAGHGVEIIFSDASVANTDEIPIPLLNAAMTLECRLATHADIRSPEAEEEVMRAAATIVDGYLAVAEGAVISTRYSVPTGGLRYACEGTDFRKG